MARFSRVIFMVETHTGGQPTRTIVGGLPRIRGKTMSEKMLYMKDKFPELFLMFTSEPRATNLSSYAVLTEPTMDEADVGAIYFEQSGYMPMCGHDTIGFATMLVETGIVEAQEPITKIAIETAAGLVHVTVEVENGRAKSVAFRNAPAFTFATDRSIDVGGKHYDFDVGYGGNFYAFVDVSQTGIDLVPENWRKLTAVAKDLIPAINEKYPDVHHPEKDYIKGVTHIMFTTPAVQDGDDLKSKNMVVMSNGEFDRSPCGTGTSARTCLLYHRGIMKPGMRLHQRSLIDSLFVSRIADVVTDFHGYTCIIPEVTGSARLSGFSQMMLDPDDEKGYGFIMR